MAFSIPALFRRGKKAQDPFGATDEEDGFFDDDASKKRNVGRFVTFGLSRFKGFFNRDTPKELNVGRSVALGLSSFMGLLLIGFILTAILAIDETAGPQVGMVPTEITQVVSEEGEVLETLIPEADETQTGGTQQDTPSTTIAMPGLSDADGGGDIVQPLGPANREAITGTAATTDRSLNRRPWLTTDQSEDEIPGMDGDQPAQVVQQPNRADSMEDLLRRSRENRPAPTDVTQMPAVTDFPSIQYSPQAQPDSLLPALPDPGLVPGAPQRFAQVDSIDVGPASAGGAPRLAEPTLPPTDTRAVSAAPPRFSTLPPAEKLAAATDAAARVAIIVEGLGLSQSATEAAIETLPPNVTLAFSPYSRELKDWLEKAAEAGHEVLVELPLESKRFPADDPGPLGLLTSLDQIENVDRLSAILDEAVGSVGILDVTGSRFRESEEHINIVLNNLDARGLFYVQGRPGLRLGNNKVPSATADVVLDERTFRASIDARLDFAERLAKYQGSSVAVASAKPVTFERIALWLDDLDRRGVSVTPVSQVLIQ